MWENGIYWHYLSSWCQPDSINSSSEEWMRLWALSGGIVPVSCLLFACLPLSVMKTFLLMARVWEAKPILQFLIAAPQILCSPYSTEKPLFFLPPRKHAFNQLLDLELKSSFKDMLMNAMKEHSVSTGKGLTVQHIVEAVCRAVTATTQVSACTRNFGWWTGYETMLRWQMRSLFSAGRLWQKRQIADI